MADDESVSVESFAGDEEEQDEAKVSSQGEEPSHSSDTHNVVKIAGLEFSKTVLRSKIMVYIILAVLAIATAAGTWHYVRNDENAEFEHEFAAKADELLKAADDKAASVFNQLHTLSTEITSHSVSVDDIWPNATLPHFYQMSRELGVLSGANLIIFAPFVESDEEPFWQEWVTVDQEKIFLDTFGPIIAPTMSPANAPRKVSDEIVQATNLTLLPTSLLLPALQYGPNASSSGLIGLDLNSHPVIQRTLRDCVLVKHPVLSPVTNLTWLLGYTNKERKRGYPRSALLEPVFDSFDEQTRKITGAFLAVEAWSSYLEGTLLASLDGFVIYIKDTCGNTITFSVANGDLLYHGSKEIHDSRYNNFVRTAEFATESRYDGPEDNVQRHCDFSIYVYPSKSYEDEYQTSKPYIYAAAVLAVFATTASVFAIYDWMVRRRRTKVVNAAKRTLAIVHSLFPREVGDRLIADAKTKNKAAKGRDGKLSAFAADREKASGEDSFDSDPIADFFTNTTIMFADIAGFTAWSSTREPKQVFQLLETIYHDFDATAQRRRVFKVETVGDCYVAVCGLPQPRADHAVVMARFALDCLQHFQALTHKLEVKLGPDTADLALRTGLHSGAVTAGVLRGERARFQLFGDTMNTASRMESTSKAQMIQISQDTADLLFEAGKGHWCRKREDLVDAKGKGKMQTFWLEVRSEGPRSSNSATSKKEGTAPEDANMPVPTGVHPAANEEVEEKPVVVDDELRKKEARLVKWNVEILTKLLVQVDERRNAAETKADSKEVVRQLEQSILNRKGILVLDEVKDIIRLPSCDTYSAKKNAVQSELPRAVLDQLQDFVQAIAGLYRENPFHNFEHASHVTMSVVKLLSRIVAPSIGADESNPEQYMHDHTYGITSDPMTQFACALSALIHDADHLGVPNTTLVKEQTATAIAYDNKSVAEQNSVDLCWSLLMQDDFKDLRCAIYSTQAEFKRFRSLVVNSVMATDIMDKDLGAARKSRWAIAFAEGATNDNSSDAVNRKATIVIEHLIQASDVAHTMQHWQVYQKWNQRLFHELYKAYSEGRAEKDPSEFWYKGEIGFFDYYIIPLAKKLKDCGVFGVSSDEYLNYAMRNKKEWELRGPQIVEEFKEAAIAEFNMKKEKEEAQELTTLKSTHGEQGGVPKVDPESELTGKKVEL